MVHLHHQISDLGPQFLVLGLQFPLSVRWTIHQTVLAILRAPTFQHAVGDLIVPRRLRQTQLAGFDPGDHLPFEIDFEFATDFSHCEYQAPQPPTQPTGRPQELWKMPQLWKSNMVAYGNFPLMISTSCLEKPALKTLRLSHIYHSSGGGCIDSYVPVRAVIKPISLHLLSGKTLQSMGRTQNHPRGTATPPRRTC